MIVLVNSNGLYSNAIHTIPTGSTVYAIFAIYTVASGSAICAVTTRRAVHAISSIVWKMGEVLRTDADYAYLLPNARKALASARSKAAVYRLEQPYTSVTEKQLLLHPWLGSRKMNTLLFLTKNLLGDELEIQSLSIAARGMGANIVTELPHDVFFERLAAAIEHTAMEDVIPLSPTQPIDCYDMFLPPALLQKAYGYNCLDVPGLQAWSREAGMAT